MGVWPEDSWPAGAEQLEGSYAPTFIRQDKIPKSHKGCNYTRKIKLDQKSRDTYYANMIIVLGSANYYDQMNC
ncbi:hypothetical protein DdX_16095 [Ditylenchus destructor]|uniref:Uncharacterized protein n=1 Tax=Ditylenchus destructor TaxID=166010 RepID=A0AAD4MU38_9BILA|nr:hypothetical protein DdX_16095 [Ditylenchus destructor]